VASEARDAGRPGAGDDSAWRRECRLFLTAVQYFTRVPVPAWVGHSAAQLDGSARYFPAIGLVLGLYSAGAYAVAAALWNPVVAALLATAATVLATGAFHEDGLADTLDGLGGGMTRERALEIMKDSRVGTFGVLALLLVMGLKVALLCAAPLPAVLVALPAAHALSRWLATSVIWRSRYVRLDESSRAKPVTSSLGTRGFALGALWMLPAVGACAWFSLPATGTALLAAWLVRAWLVRWFERRLGGYTGDALGATQQLTEVAFYLGWFVAWPWS
jgi:adenosylcobinamide-GDP ribazoletransferase